MQRVLTAIAALCLVTLAADDAAVAPAPSARPIEDRQSTIVDSPDAITIPQLLSYQGKLTDTLGIPVADTTHSVDFRLYTVPSGGSPFWSETQLVRTSGGLFSVLLGSVTPVGTMPDAGTAYLAMTVAGGTELSPRLRIAAAAYAYLTERAASSDLLQGKDTAGFVRTGQPSSVTSTMITDATVAAADLGQMGAATDQVLKWTGSVWQPRNDSLGIADNAWVRGTPDSVLYTVNRLGVARGGANNMLHGTQRQTHVNLGVACTTGLSGQNSAGATVGGGYGNRARAGYTTIGGGQENRADSICSTVGGGYQNSARHYWATVSGGYQNSAGKNYATVGGGWINRSESAYSTVGGGGGNRAGGFYATVGGGSSNFAGTHYATVSGGQDNSAVGYQSVVPGGMTNCARGTASFAAGSYARASHHGSFVWGDSAGLNDTVYTTAKNQFRVRARGGTWFYSNAGMTTGAYLAAGSNSWASACDSASKTDFLPIDRRALLERVASLPVRNYRMKDQDDGTRHIGPVAQDFAAAFGVGENSTSINLADADGVLLAAVQALYEQNQAQQAEIEALKAELRGR